MGRGPERELSGEQPGTEWEAETGRVGLSSKRMIGDQQESRGTQEQGKQVFLLADYKELEGGD